MRISKAGQALCGSCPDNSDMELIRSFARGALEPEQVYTFPVILCDNEVDRDYERFSEGTLLELAELFVGKTGISDHEWRTGNQVARIYRTEILRDADRKTAAGDAYVCLKAWAYMLRTEANESLIADIEGGIKKEVSVGCSVGESVCSICGKPMQGTDCVHVKGETYGGRLCFAELRGAVDAYEWSFVAVPAQRGAGVTKTLNTEKGLAGFVESDTGAVFSAEFETLKKEAALGRQYLTALRTEVKRLALLCGRDLHDSLSPSLSSMDAESLLGLKSAFEKRVAERIPLQTQLPGVSEVVRFDGEAYLV